MSEGASGVACTWTVINTVESVDNTVSLIVYDALKQSRIFLKLYKNDGDMYRSKFVPLTEALIGTFASQIPHVGGITDILLGTSCIPEQQTAHTHIDYGFVVNHSTQSLQSIVNNADKRVDILQDDGINTLIDQITLAICCLHSMRIVHCNLTQNVIYAKVPVFDVEYVWSLTDFGHAHCLPLRTRSVNGVCKGSIATDAVCTYTVFDDISAWGRVIREVLVAAGINDEKHREFANLCIGTSHSNDPEEYLLKRLYEQVYGPLPNIQEAMKMSFRQPTVRSLAPGLYLVGIARSYIAQVYLDRVVGSNPNLTVAFYLQYIDIIEMLLQFISSERVLGRKTYYFTMFGDDCLATQILSAVMIAASILTGGAYKTIFPDIYTILQEADIATFMRCISQMGSAIYRPTIAHRYGTWKELFTVYYYYDQGTPAYSYEKYRWAPDVYTNTLPNITNPATHDIVDMFSLSYVTSRASYDQWVKTWEGAYTYYNPSRVL